MEKRSLNYITLLWQNTNVQAAVEILFMNCKLDYITDISRRRMCNIILDWEYVRDRERKVIGTSLLF